MKLSAGLALSVALGAGLPAAAQDVVRPPAELAPDGATAVFEVVRPGDTQMSCEALVSEINSLNAEVQAMQQALTSMGTELSRSSMAATARTGGGGGGGALGLAGMVAGFIPGGGLVTGGAQMLRQQSAQAAWQAQQRAILDQTAGLASSITDMAPRANRAAHLSEIMRSRSC